MDGLKMPIRKSLEFAARLGASAVQLDARSEINPSQLSDTGVRQLRKMLEDLDLRVAALRFPTRRGYDNPSDLDRRVEATKSMMEFAYKLQCPVVVNQIGRIPDDQSDSRWISLASVMHDLGRHGAKVGAFFAAETGAEPGEKLAQILDGHDDGFVGVAFNPGQLAINQHDIAAALDVLKDRVQVVCAVDGVVDLAAGRGITVPLGQGIADFPSIIGGLEDVQFRGHFVVGRSDSTMPELSQGVEYLRNL